MNPNKLELIGREWMGADPSKRFLAYYLLLRYTYGYPTLEAFLKTREVFKLYPEFMGDPYGTIRGAISHG